MRSNPRIVYGVHSLTPYDRVTGLPYGTLEIIGGAGLSLTGELAELNGGSSRFPVAVEDTTISAELAIKPKEYPDFLFELFLGKSPVSSSAESGGSVTAIANKFGATVVAATGILSVGIKSGGEADVKFNKYIVKAVSPTTVDVYAMSSVDFGQGTVKTHEDDLLKINATPLTITMSAAVEVVGFGIELTGGGGTIAMVADDTAEFTAKPINAGSMDVIVGGNSDVFPEFGAIAMAQKSGSGALFELDIFRVKAIGLPFGLEEKAFSEAEITAKAFYDSAKGGVFSVRSIDI